MANRINYGKLIDVLEIPDLIEIQTHSYTNFLQLDKDAEKREDQGLQEVFKEIFPIESFDKSCELDYVSYEIGEPKTSIVECLRTGKTHAVPLYVTLKLENRKSGDSKLDRVFLGDMPLMTDRGTFIVNGAERVIISQLHRSPGICFENVKHSSGRTLLSFRIIPDRGGWMEVQFDINDLIYIYLDRRRRRRKFLMSTFLRAMGYSTDRELLDVVYGIKKKKISALKKELSSIEKYILAETVTDPDGNPLTDSRDNEIGKALEVLSEDLITALAAAGVKDIEVVETGESDYFINCLRNDPCTDTEDALKEIYKRMRPGDPASVANAKSLLHRLFMDQKRYDLGVVGRHKINQKLGTDFDSSVRTLQAMDLVKATLHLMKLRTGVGNVDDIDHLGSRRVRTVGELIQNQFRVGLARTERLVRERMTLLDLENDDVTPQKLVNPKALVGVVRDFFGRSQLSQFMDQTNPLSELTNKRRLSALGPGGLNRERASFEVRDVHSSHYGRVCPIETPEGPNIGLISSLALYGRVNKFGFIETPYRRVKDKKVTEEIVYLAADEEEDYVIVQANAPLDEKGFLSNRYVMCRHEGDTFEGLAENVDYMDVSPKQLVSAAAGLIPFLEHDDANRALMGSNMQRQAVPLLRPESPYVGTGLEAKVAEDSRAVICAREAGIVAAVDSTRVVISKDGKLPEDLEKDTKKSQVYLLNKFMRSNSSTCINQKPSVRTGQKIEKGDVIADGTATEKGELALGKNVRVAFMPWGGYNFEDAIIVSERLVKDDVYTSIHISEFDITARDTKLGPEEITRDIPNVSEDALRNLGHEGIVRIGAEVNPGDILVGKITPKSETELDPEERLLRAIFGEKAADVKDSSLTVSSGCSGIVMDVEIERKADPNATKLTKVEIKRHIREAKNTFKAEYDELLEDLAEKLSTKLLGSKLPFDILHKNNDEAGPIIPANRKITKVLLRKLASNHDNYKIPNGPTRDQIEEIMKAFRLRLRDIETRRDEIIARYESGGEEEQGIIKSVKVYVASKRKIEVGDKMAGRHGNKGIVSTIVPAEDMPHLADGTPVDIILNPLGVPSRMNVGQVLETHLGHAAKILGFKIATPVFDGISEEKIHELLSDAKKKEVEERGWKVNSKGETVDENGTVQKDYYIENDGKVVLYDGQTGEKFKQRIMVGEIYMLKLDHLVVNKIHARSVGPYSLVTQQPLGGKAQHGGQRFGEMEVWALEAYGAAYALQEMLTVKSDDVTGRTRIYESIVRGDNSLQADVPESFNVLMNEMKSLCLDIKPQKGVAN